jgi:hypothetical protein
MTTWVFDFYNLYLPEGSEYRSTKYNIRIEPLKIAETFEEKRTDRNSKFSTDYWRTSKVYIKQDIDRAKELADWLSHIYSLAQNRDVCWTRYYPYADGYTNSHFRSTTTLALDNSGTRYIKGISGNKQKQNLGEFVDIALQTFDQAPEHDRSHLIGSIMTYLESKGQTFWSFGFLNLWMILESMANKNYRDYLQQPDNEPLFTSEERDELRETVISHLKNGDWSASQIQRIQHTLEPNYIFEMSTETRIKIYLEYLNIGFDIDEIQDITQTAQEIRNPIVHKLNSEKLMNQVGVVQKLRKIIFYVLLRELGVEKDLQERFVTPILIGPDID